MNKKEANPGKLTIIPRDQHNISRKSISKSALKVLYRLTSSGYRACLVGGGVRDLLLKKQPKDFDIATDCTPEQVRALFRNSRIIGRRFRLVHIRFGREVIEVATFRSHSADSPRTELNAEGRILRDNTFGDIEDDAIRRDFTVNALYYDIENYSILDYTHGLADIESRSLRLIGDPNTRYQEDPVRMLRAVRFAAKLEFDIEQETASAIFDCGYLLRDIPAARLFDEVLKLFHSGKATRVFELLRHYELLQYLFPALDEILREEPVEAMLDFIDQALVNTDARVNSEQHVSPAFIFAILLWPAVHQRATVLESDQLKLIPALSQAGSEVMGQQLKHIAIPRRFSQMARDIWVAQPKFERIKGKQPNRLSAHPWFRAAYDFMCIQSMVGLVPTKLCLWWTDFQQSHQVPDKHHTRHEPRRNRPVRKRQAN
ncbi:MAG: polynucleotide adenylyltransferase PcnB [Gammaproteobacteria bacterium]